jgi:hypothetical protein
VHDLILHGNDLIIATHGRAFWSLDNITALREMNSEDANADTYLFKPATAYRFRGGRFRIPGGFAAGENPPSGAVIDYSLKTEPKQPITLEIMDSSGKVIRKYKSRGQKPAAEEPPEESFFRGGRATLPAKAGLNRFEWDLRYESPSVVPGAVAWGGRPIGPLAVPGNYQVKLTVEGKSYTAPLKVEEDPRIKVSQEDLQKQLDFSLQIRGRVTEAHDAVNQIRDIHGQLAALEKRLADDKKTKATADAAKDLDKKFADVEEALIQVKSKTGEDPLNFPIMIADQMMALDSTVQSADTAPTQSSHQVFDLLSKQLDEQMAKYRQLKDKDLADFNNRIRSEDIPAIAAPVPHGDASGGDRR